MAFMRDSLFSDFWNYALATVPELEPPCESGDSFCAKLLKEHPDITFGDAFTQLQHEDINWCLWSTILFGDEFDPEMLELHLGNMFTHAMLPTTDALFAALILKELYARWTLQRRTSLLDKTQAAVISPSADEGKAVALFGLMHEHMSVASRSTVLNRITDPMRAFRIYIKVADLTDAEDLILESTFKGKLQTAEKQLEDGVVIRAKPTAITPRP